MNTQTARHTPDDDLNGIAGNQYILRSGKRRAIPRLVQGMKRHTNSEAEKIPDISGNTQQDFLSAGPVIQTRNFTMLQQWEGRVISVSQDTFTAIITNRTSPQNSPEEVEIELSEISQDDISLIRPGAFFYWSIGYEDASGIPRQRVSRIRFRRLPSWTKREINQAKQHAQQFSDLFA